MDIKLINALQQLNFSLNEAKAYEALAKLGQTTAGEVIKTTGLHRSVTYDTLEKLIARKLVFKLTRKNLTHFQLTDPNKILQHLQVQQDVAQDLIPKIKDLVNSRLPEITIYEGRESYRNYWIGSSLSMEPGSTDYVAGSLGKKWQEIFGKAGIEKYLRLRMERKIKLKMIVFNKDSLELDMLKEYPDLHEYRFIKYADQTIGNFNVLDDKCVVLNSGTEPLLIEIKNPTMVKTFMNLFNVLWRSGEEITK